MGFLSSGIPGGSPQYSNAKGVSDDGKFAVGEAFGFESEGFRWSQATGMLESTAFLGDATSTSSNGGIVVGSAFTTASTQGPEAYYWTNHSPGVIGIGFLPGQVSSRASAISSDGTAIVGSSGNGGNATQAFRWTASEGMQGLGFLSGTTYSESSATNQNGSVVVGTSGSGAFRWTNVGGMVDIGKLSISSTFSFPAAISNDGTKIVGTSGIPSERQAFLWREGAGMVGIGDLSGGAFDSEARDISGDGRIVVGSSASGLGQEAFVWNEEMGMRRLWDLLVESGVNPADSGWTSLNSANGIDFDGNTIVGFGTRNGLTEAFYSVIPIPLAVPEPHSVLLVLAGIIHFARQRNIRSRVAL